MLGNNTATQEKLFCEGNKQRTDLERSIYLLRNLFGITITNNKMIFNMILSSYLCYHLNNCLYRKEVYESKRVHLILPIKDKLLLLISRYLYSMRYNIAYTKHA